MRTERRSLLLVHNADSFEWNYLHSCTFVSIGPPDSIFVKLYAVLAVSDELLAIVSWRNRDDPDINGFSLVRSEGFGSAASDIRWEKVLEPTPFLEDLERNESDYPEFSMHCMEI